MNVSRETIARLEEFCALLLKWNQRINLISKASVEDVWDRHVVDSIQLYALGGEGHHWVDLGSGGGLPGIVLSIMAMEHHPERQFTLVESDQRKCAFLREASRVAGSKVTVLGQRIEHLAPLNADILSARALAPLSMLLQFSARHRDPAGRSLFPKGTKYEQEIADARKTWHFDPVIHQSTTDPHGTIVEVRNVSHV